MNDERRLTDAAAIQIGMHVTCDGGEYRVVDLIRPRTIPHKLCARLEPVGDSKRIHGLISVDQLGGVRPARTKREEPTRRKPWAKTS